MTGMRALRIEAASGALSHRDFEGVPCFVSTPVADNPADAQRYFLQGMAEASTGRLRSGIEYLEHAIAIDPQGEYRAQLAKLFIMVRLDGDAAATLRDAEAALPSDALSLDTMGCVYARLGDHHSALTHFNEAVRLDPSNTEYLYNQAVTLNFLGRVAEASAALEALIAPAPGDARAHHLLAKLRKYTVDSNHVDRLTRVYAKAGDARDRLLLGYSLAKELEDIGQAAQALQVLCAANAEHRQALPYTFARDAANFDAVEAAWPLPAGHSDAPAEAPIFIIGMPRTGTTLVDRILSSHPAVESAGELQAMPLAVKHAARTSTPTVMDPATIAAASKADISAIGRDFLNRASHHRRDFNKRFIDKFPGNTFYAGFIAQALPSARIICVRRNPMDTVLSNFRNLFAISSRYYDYSYDLLDTAAYYVRFHRLMEHWRDALPGRMIEVQYEDLVADQEGETRRMLAHCGLVWSEACLAFHTNSAPVSTPSAAQVRRPIYADSVARWKQHAEILEPVRRFFVAQGIPLE